MLNKRVLVVDDNAVFLFAIKDLLKYNNYEVVCAQSVIEANLEVKKALETNNLFKVALIDLRLGNESGAEFAQRLMEMVPNISIAVITAYHDPAAEMLFKPDDVIIKTASSTDTVLEKVARLLECSRVCKDPPDVILNQWQTSCCFPDINIIKPLTSILTNEGEEQTEQFISLTKDKLWISTIVYPSHPGDNFKKMAIQTSLGCNMFCQMCSNWQTQKGANGERMPYVRALELEEMLTQVYGTMKKSPRIKNLFKTDSNDELLVNFTGPGDGLVNNLDNVASMIKRLSENKKPLISFVVTSVGKEDKLQEYLDKYIDLPRVTFYWSLNSINPIIRMSLMPGTRSHSIEKMADLFEEISRKTGNPTTVSFALFKGINDNKGDAKKLLPFSKTDLCSRSSSWLGVQVACQKCKT